jgi:hypothetical protein
MTLLDRANEVKDLCLALSNHNDVNNEIVQCTAALEDLKDVTARLEDARAFLQALIDEGLSPADSAMIPDVRAELNALTNGAGDLVADPAAKARLIHTRLRQWASPLIRSCTEHFQEWAAQEFANAANLDDAEGLATSLAEADSDELQSASRQIRRLVLEARALEKGSPSPSVFAKIRETAEGLRAAVDEVAPTEETRAFLRGLVGAGADLHSFNSSEAIRKWATDIGLDGQIVLTLRRGRVHDE